MQQLVTGQTAFKASYRRGSKCACVHRCVCMNILVAFQTDWLERRKRIWTLIPFTFECCVSSVLISVAGHVCFCLPGTRSQPCYWLDLRVWKCSGLVSIKVRDSATSAVTHLSIPVCAVTLFCFSLLVFSSGLFSLVFRWLLCGFFSVR